VDEADTPIATLGGRLTSVDALRGLVMVLMALDHTRDFLQDTSIDPLDPSTTTVALYFSRWITHFCAPVFVFLAGASAYLMGAQGKVRTTGDLAKFLMARGGFLMVLELTAVRLGLFFNWSLDGMFLQVIWAIGLSMVVLGSLIGVAARSRMIAVLGVAIVLGHNLLDLAISPPVRGSMMRPNPGGLLFTFLFRPGPLPLAEGVTWFEAYPLLPWFGIMALGYAFGEVLVRERWSRVRLTGLLGLGATAAFVVLRASALYGDPAPFRAQDTAVKSVLAFLNCQKYPPSLLYVLMTLGPGLLVLAALDFTEGEIAYHSQRAGLPRRFLVTLGRVPLFFYLLQWPAIRLVTTTLKMLSGREVSWFWSPFGNQSGHGYSLPVVYAMWALVVALLYVPCHWYAGLKRRRRDWKWLSYL
jgi:uncharacterized membrane protein